jgi:signal transduction histidine kinase
MSINETLERLSRQWGIDCQLARCPDGTASRPEFDHQIGQLIREAVANAAKHGGATRVTVSLDVAHSQLSLRIRDNGCGFPVSQSGGAGTQLAPWSLNERVHELGGTLMLASTSEGSEVTMGLPWREPS